MLEKIGQDGSLSDRVAEEVLRYILDNQLTEGDRLPNETTLSEKLNVGRSTIREAMKLLASRNIVSIEHGRGTFIKDRPGQISDPLGFRFNYDKQKLLTDLIELRLIVEPPIAALAALRRTEDDIRRIAAIQDEVERMVAQKQNHGPADARFHSSIASASQNSVSSAMVPILNQSVDLVISISGQSSLDRTMQYHRNICAAIRDGDPEAAERIMREHLTDHHDFILKVFAGSQGEAKPN